MKKENGFTLVELAIVLMIIGLLIGGILRGQELMQNARVTSTVQQIKSYEGAKITFHDQYAAKPGDFLQALNRLPGCTAANSCRNGDGNGIVGESAGKVGERPASSAVTTENTQFWKHLAMAHLISGVEPSASSPAWGKTHPAAKIGGGFVVYYNIDPTDNGLYMFIQNPIVTWTAPWMGRGKNPMSPVYAAMIDRKMDDGLPETGNVQAYPADNFCKVTNSTNRYIETNQSLDCVLSYKFD